MLKLDRPIAPSLSLQLLHILTVSIFASPAVYLKSVEHTAKHANPKYLCPI